MVDIHGKDEGNISLPSRLQSPKMKDGVLHYDGPIIINMQKTFYDIKIAELNKRINRLEEENNELSDLCKTTEFLTTTTDADTTEQITGLKRQLAAEIAKVENCKNQLHTIKQSREEEKLIHAKHMETLNKKYADTRVALLSQIKLLCAKINMLEDYKKTQTALQNKLEAGNNLMLQEQQSLTYALDRIDRKFKIDRDKLEKTTYNSLLDQANTFQMDVIEYIPKPIHKLIRENIILLNNISQIANEGSFKMQHYPHIKYMRKEHYQTINMKRKDTKRRIVIIKLQNGLLKLLKEMHEKLEELLLHALSSQSNEKKVLLSIENSKNDADTCEMHVRKLEVILHRQQSKLNAAKYLYNKVHCQLKKYVEILYDIKYLVAYTLKMIGTCPHSIQEDGIQLFTYFLNILDRSELTIKNTRVNSMESMPPSIAYLIGDLGFEPQHVDVRKVIHSEVKSTLSILKAIELLQTEVRNEQLQKEIMQNEENEEYEKSRSMTDISEEDLTYDDNK